MSAPLTALTRRERHIMDILFRLGRATADEVMREMPGEPSYSTVRTQLRVLEEKGHVRHEEQGRRYIYMPAVARSTARRSALRHVIDTFFDGSVENVVAALLGGDASKLSDEELDRIAEMVKAAKPAASASAKAPADKSAGGRGTR
jgi:predicted transcriptional regulator